MYTTLREQTKLVNQLDRLLGLVLDASQHRAMAHTVVPQVHMLSIAKLFR